MGIEDLLKRNAKINPDYFKNKPNKFEVARNYKRLEKLIVNMNDMYGGAFDPEDYFKRYQYFLHYFFSQCKMDSEFNERILQVL